MTMRTIAHKKGGFTLIETVVSVTLLVLAVVGPMTLASNSLRVSRDARAELEAIQIANEGLEIVHNIRDNNSADDSTPTRTEWMDGIYPECQFGCVADVTNHTGPTTNVWGANALKGVCTSGTLCDSERFVMYQDPTTGLYRQRHSALGGSWEKTNYTRKIIVTQVTAGRQVQVTSIVTYIGYGGGPRTITVSEDLYNWFPSLN